MLQQEEVVEVLNKIMYRKMDNYLHLLLMVLHLNLEVLLLVILLMEFILHTQFTQQQDNLLTMVVMVRLVVKQVDGQVELMVKAALEEEVQLVHVTQVVAVVAADMLAEAEAVEIMFLVLAEVHLVLMLHQIIQLQFSLTSVKEKLSSLHYVIFL